MDLRQLRYFIKIVECGTMTRAAEALHIAQPALTQQISKLEGELDCRLLTRSVHGVKATRSGELLYRHAKDVLRAVERARAAVDQESAMPTGRVSVAMPSSTARILTGELLLAVRERYSNICLELVEGSSVDLPEQVMHGRVEIAIVAGERPTKGLNLQAIVEEDLFVLSSPKLKLPSSRIKLQDLAKLPLILPSWPNYIRSRLDQALMEANLAYEVVAEASTTSLAVSAAKRGIGVTVLPWSAVSEEAGETLRAARLTDPSIRRQLAMCTSQLIEPSPAGEKVRDTIVDVVRRLIRTGRWQGAREISGSEK